MFIEQYAANKVEDEITREGDTRMISFLFRIVIGMIPGIAG